MPGIFISYRRDDSIGHAGRLYDLLTNEFGKDRVFMDIDTIGPGDDFVEVIDRTCQSCDVLLAVIGRTWATSTDANGRRRLDDSRDFVRLEILRALEHGIRVVPVLVDGAEMPPPEAFPAELQKLAQRQAWELNDKRFRHDVGQLVEALRKIQPELGGGAGRMEAGRAEASRIEKKKTAEPPSALAGAVGLMPWWRRYYGAAAVAIAVVVLLSAGYFVKLRKPRQSLSQLSPGGAATVPASPASNPTPPADSQLTVSGKPVDAVEGLKEYANSLHASQSSSQPPDQTTWKNVGPFYRPDAPNSSTTSEIPSLHARVSGPLLFFLAPTGADGGFDDKPPATVFRSAETAGTPLFWRLWLHFDGPLPPPDYQVESRYYHNGQMVNHAWFTYKGSNVQTPDYHFTQYEWTPNAALDAGTYRVDLFIGGQPVTSGTFLVE